MQNAVKPGKAHAPASGSFNDPLCPGVAAVPACVGEGPDHFKHGARDREIGGEFREELLVGGFSGKAVGRAALQFVLGGQARSGNDEPAQKELLVGAAGKGHREQRA